MQLSNFYKINIKISVIIEFFLLSIILFFNHWIGIECFDFYIFSSAICKVVGYAAIIFYPIIKFKSKIYEMEMTGENYEVFYTICSAILFIVQIILIILKIKFPLLILSLTSFYEMYYIFFNNKKEY
jgi:hypothetical protein